MMCMDLSFSLPPLGPFYSLTSFFEAWLKSFWDLVTFLGFKFQMWGNESALDYQDCGLLSSERWFPPSWQWAPVLCSGSAGSTPSPSASAVTRPVTDCTLDTCAPGGPVYKETDGLGVWQEKRGRLQRHRQREDWHCSHTDRKIFDLIAPEGQSPATDVQHYVWSQTRQHHGFVLLRGRQLRPHNVQLPRQRRGAGRADGWGAAELAGPVLLAERMRAGRDPGESVQLGPTLWEVTQECVVAERHGQDCGEHRDISVEEISTSL